MKRLRVAIALCAMLAASAAGRAAAPGDDLLARMAGVNANLHAFTATLRAHVALKSFPFLGADVVGTYYYKEPDKNKVVLQSGVPMLASQFDKLYAHIESPAKWRSVYEVTLVSDDGRTALFALVPRKRGNVARIDAAVDDKTATVARMRWNYQNGGYAEMVNHYGNVDGFVVIRSQNGHVEEPGYVADITSALDEYKMNPSLPDDLFASP